MTNRSLPLLLAFCAALGAPVAAHAQRRQPVTHFESADFQKLRWLEGRWVGNAPAEAPFYEEYRFPNDSTLVITYYADSTFSRATGGAKVYLSVEHVYQTLGPSQWAAERVDKDGAYFVPLVNAATSLIWAYQSPDGWTSTMRSAASGQERTTVYHMRRLR